MGKRKERSFYARGFRHGVRKGQREGMREERREGKRKEREGHFFLHYFRQPHCKRKQ